jgi:hypothetical protein
MRKILHFVVFFAFIAGFASAQEALKVDFKSDAAQETEAGWEKIVIKDKTIPEVPSYSYSKFSGTVKVEPVWLNTPIAANVRAVNRATNFYKGDLALVINNFTGVDVRNASDCDAVGVKISGLPAGTYSWKSYHHDVDDQHGKFTVKIENNAGVLVEDPTERLITHSKVVSFTEGYVIGSLDSICQYKYDKIVSAGVNDVIKVSFKSTLPPDANMTDHSVKIIFINGFILTKVSGVGVSEQVDEKLSIMGHRGGSISIKGENLSKVELYSVNGTLLRRENKPGNEMNITNLNEGIYLVKVSKANGEISCRKIAIR